MRDFMPMRETERGTYVFDYSAPEPDYLGPANAEQRAETWKSWRTWFWNGVRMYVAAAAVVALFGTVGVICMLLGAANSEVVLETFSEVLR